VDWTGHPLLLFEKEELPLDQKAQERVEYSLLMFIVFLCRVEVPKPLLGITIDGYVGHVKAVHVKLAGGLAFKDLLVCCQRLKGLKHSVMKQRPSTARTKVGFEVAHYVPFVAAAVAAKRSFIHKAEQPKKKKAAKKRRPSKKQELRMPVEPKDVPFLLDRIKLGVSVAMVAILRSSELVANKYKSAAEKADIMLSDFKFFRVVRDVEQELMVMEDGRLEVDACHVSYATCRMPPNKGDPIQRQDNDLIFPRKLDPVHDPDGALENVVNLFNDYPIDRRMHSATPLLRSRRIGVQRLIKRTEFVRDFRWVCKLAKLQYKQWGTHAFRVGGMNALQDAGASVAEIMALGHWRSDAWLLYSRRNRPRLQEWSKQILHVRQRGEGKANMPSLGAIKRTLGDEPPEQRSYGSDSENDDASWEDCIEVD